MLSSRENDDGSKRSQLALGGAGRHFRTMIRFMTSCACLIVATFAQPAHAASSQWMDSEGGRVRIVTSGLADADGRLRGALQIDLKPGWKTYWRDPGEAGVPPQIELSGGRISQVDILFPTPTRIVDKYATWAGYTHSVNLPLVMAATPGNAGLVEGEVFLGICQTICIPFQSTFSFDAGANPDDPADAMIVEAAFAALPGEPRTGFQVTQLRQEAARLIIETQLPQGSEDPELFIAAPEGGQLSPPRVDERAGERAVFSSELTGDPGQDAAFHYTLVKGEHAVNGTLPLPPGHP